MVKYVFSLKKKKHGFCFYKYTEIYVSNIPFTQLHSLELTQVFCPYLPHSRLVSAASTSVLNRTFISGRSRGTYAKENPEATGI